MKGLRDARGRFTGPILTWGVELEGGFDGDYEGQAASVGWDIDWDESVETYAENAELVSPIYNDLGKLKHDLKMLYGYVVDMNNSMGFHIHIGVPRAVYFLLSTWGFVDFFQRTVVNEFPVVRNRLNNHFCSAWRGPESDSPYGPEWPRHHTLQMQAEGKYSGNGNDRFKAINYCYGLHKTIEFRLFPACDEYYEAFRYLDFVKWAVGEWVGKHDLDLIHEGVEEADAKPLGEVVVNLGGREIPLGEPADLGAHFEKVLGVMNGGPPYVGGRTWAELDGQLVYPHAPGCAVCDQVRMHREAELLRIHNPGTGERLRVATHFNGPDEWTGTED